MTTTTLEPERRGNKQSKMNYPAASCGVSEERDENYPKGVTPECFYRGSTVLLTTTLSHVEWVGGPVPDPPVVSQVEPPLKTCGNDGLWKGNQVNAASC